MDFEWDYLLIVTIAGLSTFIIIGVRKAWMWYRRLESGRKVESLEAHIHRIEEEYKK